MSSAPQQACAATAFVGRLLASATSACAIALLQIGVVPLTRWYDMFTSGIPSFFSEPRSMVDKIAHDRSAVTVVPDRRACLPAVLPLQSENAATCTAD